MALRLRSVTGVAMLYSRWAIRQPSWFAQGVATALAYFVILWAWGGIEALRNLVIAWIVASAWSLGMNIVAQKVGWSWVTGEMDMFVASPVTPITYFSGVLVGSSIFLAIDACVATAISIVLGSPLYALAGLAAAALLIPVSLLAGLAVVLRIERPTNILAVTRPLTAATILLPPVYYPATVLPENLRVVALIVPTSAAAELARSLSGIHHVYPPLYPLLSLLAWLVVLLASLRRVVRWGLR